MRVTFSLNSNYSTPTHHFLDTLLQTLFFILGLPFAELFKYKDEDSAGSVVELVKNIFLYVLVNCDKSNDRKPVNETLLDRVADLIFSFGKNLGIYNSDIEALFQFNENLKNPLMDALHLFIHRKNYIFEPSAYKSLKKHLIIII